MNEPIIILDKIKRLVVDMKPQKYLILSVEEIELFNTKLASYAIKKRDLAKEIRMSPTHLSWILGRRMNPTSEEYERILYGAKSLIMRKFGDEYKPTKKFEGESDDRRENLLVFTEDVSVS